MEVKIREKTIHSGIIIACTVAVCAVLIAVGFGVGRHTKLNQTVKNEIKAEQLKVDEEYNTKKKEIENASNEISSITAKLDDQKEEFAAFNDYLKNKETKEGEIASLDAQIQTKTGELTTLGNTITQKQGELDSLVSVIKQTGEAPITIPAGQYTVGSDIKAGRYSVKGSSNFVVYSSTGSLKVNTILGSGSYANDSYTCSLTAGDSVKAESKITLTPIK